jgi:hypothetical protein
MVSREILNEGPGRHSEPTAKNLAAAVFAVVMMFQVCHKKSRGKRMPREILRERHDGAVIQWMRDPP